ATVPASYLSTPGAHTIHGRIKDKDGGFTDYTTTLTVNAPVLASISGTVFADNNGNAKLDAGELGVSGRKLYIDKNKNGILDADGIKDSTEVALSGWVVYLDTNNNGVLDAGEQSFTTGSDGKFSFVIPSGTYHLREVLKAGFKRTTPSTGVYLITLFSGKTAT